MKISKLGDKEYTREEAEAIKAEIERHLAEPEYRFWEGQLVECRDDCDAEWTSPRRFYCAKGERFSTSTRCSRGETDWDQCRPLQDPNILQFKPHDASEECPCQPGLDVLLKYCNGTLVNSIVAASAPWHLVKGWMPANGWTEKWWSE